MQGKVSFTFWMLFVYDRHRTAGYVEGKILFDWQHKIPRILEKKKAVVKAAHNISLSMFLNDRERAVFKECKIPMVIDSLAGLAVSLFHRFIPFSTSVNKGIGVQQGAKPSSIDL